MAIVEELIGRLGFQTSGMGQATQFQQKIEGIKSSLSGLQLLATGAMAVAMGGFAKGIIETGSQMEKFAIQLEGLEGSAEKGRKAMDWIRVFAEKTPLELPDVISAYQRLKNFGLDPTNGSLLAMVDTMAMSGKGAAALDSITTGLGQAWAMSKLQGDNWNQISDAGVPVMDLLTKATGKTAEQLLELREKGKLGRKEIQLLINAMGVRAQGQSEKFSQSLDGITANLNDMKGAFFERISNAGIFAAWKGQLESLYVSLRRMRDDGTMDLWAKRISDVMVGALGSFARFKNGVADVAAWVQKHGSIDILKLPLFAGLMFAATRFPIVAAITGTIAVLDDFIAWFRNEEHLIPWDRMTNLESLKGLIRDIEGELTRTANALDQLIQKYTGLPAFNFSNVFDPAQGEAAMAQLMGRMVDVSAAKWEEIRSAIANKLAEIDALILGAFKIDLSGSAYDMMMSFVAGLIRGAEKVTQTITDIANKIRSGLSGITIDAPHMTIPGGKAGPPVKRDFSKDGMSDPANPGIKKGASLDRALARTQLASVAPGVRGGAGARIFNDNSQNNVTVQVPGTNATPNQIAATTQRALQSSKNLHFQGATNPAVV